MRVKTIRRLPKTRSIPEVLSPQDLAFLAAKEELLVLWEAAESGYSIEIDRALDALRDKPQP